MMKKNQILLVACLMLAFEYSFLSNSLAHESAPSRAWLSIDNQNKLSMALSLDVGSFIANTSDTTLESHSEAHDVGNKVSQNTEFSPLSTKFHQLLRKGNSPVVVENQQGERLDLVLQSVAMEPDLTLMGSRKATMAFTARLMPNDNVVRLRPSIAGNALIANVQASNGDDVSGIDQTYYVLAGELSPPLVLRGSGLDGWPLVSSYLKAGFVHVLPKGIDHVLFVVALLLLVTSWRQLCLYVTLFTLGHSIALALAAVGFVNMNSAIVEPFIAGSIVYMAVEYFRGTPQLKLQTIMVFVFGLVHGLGFANVLSTNGLTTGSFVSALLAFNIGIELAQLLVVALCTALNYTVMSIGHWRNNPLATPTSLLIGSAGSWMLIERTLL